MEHDESHQTNHTQRHGYHFVAARNGRCNAGCNGYGNGWFHLQQRCMEQCNIYSRRNKKPKEKYRLKPFPRNTYCNGNLYKLQPHVFIGIACKRNCLCTAKPRSCCSSE